MDDLLPPDEAEYATRETLVRSVQEHASAHGYAVAIKRSCDSGTEGEMEALYHKRVLGEIKEEEDQD
jgi:hypothetical protein